MRKQSKIVSAVTIVTAFSVITRGLSFLFKIYISRVLGAEAIGLYQIALSVFVLFASFSASGIPLVLSRKTAEHYAINDNTNHSLFSSALFLGVTISGISIILLSIVGNRIRGIFSDPLAYPLFFIMLPALLSTAIISCVRGLFWGKKDFKLYSIAETLEEILQIAFGVIFTCGIFTSISGAKALSLALTISDIIVAIILLLLYFRKGGNVTKPLNKKELLYPAIPLTSMRVCASLIVTLVAFILPTQLMQNGMSLSEATASFGRISGMANPLLYAPNAILGSLAVVLIPEMSANGIKKDFATLNKHLNNGINFSFLISGMFMVVYIAIGEELTTLIFKDAISGKYLQFASYILLPMSIMQLTQSAINSIGKEYNAFFNYIVGNVVMIVAIIFLPKYIGIYSVAVAMMLSLLIISTLNINTLKKAIDFDLSFIKNLVLVFLLIFPCAYMCYSVNNIISKFFPNIGIFIGSIIGIGSYFLMCNTVKLVDIKAFLKLRKKK